MATPQRFFQKNAYYHVYNRGNRKQPIFLEWNDYIRFIKRAVEYKAEIGISILSYCLLPNHFHFLLKQVEADRIYRFMLRLSTSYSKYFNTKYEQVGSLFQGRFKAKFIDKDEYLMYLSTYIHLNPAGRTLDELLQYPWSSLPVYINNAKGDFCDPGEVLELFSKTDPRKDYKNFMEGLLKTRNFHIISHLID